MRAQRDPDTSKDVIEEGALPVSQEEEECQVIPIPLSLREKKKDVAGQIKSEWLGVEARVHLPPPMLAGNRFIRWQQRYSIGRLLVSFLSGIAMGGALAFYVTRTEAGPVMPNMVKAVNPSEV